MIVDFFANLSQEHSDATTLECFITQYHQRIATGKKDEANELRDKWKMENISKKIDSHVISLLDLIQYPKIDFSYLPEYSFTLQFTFTLEKPYISRDEQDFYIIDNPIRKDRVFGLPYVAPSSWKGSLRAALWQNGHEAENDGIRRIFGNERTTKEQEELKAGRLHIFPTFFKEKDLEVINPHDRKTRVGKNPIFIESVPKDASSLFTLLYVPFNLIGKEEKKIKKQVSEDIQLLVSGLKAMFMDYGFGAKTSSGYGIAKSDLTEGNIILKAVGIETSQEEDTKIHEPEESFKKYLNENGSVKEDFKDSGDVSLLTNPEYGERGQQLGGGSLKEFKRFRRWYKDYGVEWQKHFKYRDILAPEWPIWTFTDFEELVKLADQIESSLNQQEESQ